MIFVLLRLLVADLCMEINLNQNRNSIRDAFTTIFESPSRFGITFRKPFETWYRYRGSLSEAILKKKKKRWGERGSQIP